MDKARILIINGQSLYRNNATGITLRSIVENIPSDSIMELFRFETMDPIKERYDFKSIQIPPKAMPINYLVRKLSGHDNYYELEESTALQIQQKEAVSRFGLKRKLFSTIKAISENTFIRADNSFLAKVDSFRPNYIYTMGASFFVINWALFLQKRYDCPIVIHYMDNWRETMYTDGTTPRLLNAILQSRLVKLERTMLTGMTISQYMAEAYEKKYGKKYLPLMNVVPQIDYYNEHTDTTRYVYAGGLHLDRHKQLMIIEKALKTLKAEGHEIRFDIFTSTANQNMYQKFFDSTITNFNAAVPHERVGEIYKSGDVLIHVESFDKDIVEYTKYSMSTKIPEYMAAGKAILCFAPDNIASFQYIKKSKAGVCASDYLEVLKAVRYLLDADNRREFSSNGKNIARINHSSDQMNAVVKEIFGL